jgi:vacuolar protein sorting-associated protein 11
MASNPNVTLGMVKPFLLKVIGEDAKDIKRMNSLIKNYKDEIEANKANILEIQNNQITFQTNKCELCRQDLQLPTINFLCKHSYHSK